MNAELADFIDSPADAQKRLLAGLRQDATEHGRFLHENLAELYAYNFGYRDGACTVDVDDAQEIGMFRARVALERELFDQAQCSRSYGQPQSSYSVSGWTAV